MSKKITDKQQINFYKNIGYFKIENNTNIIFDFLGIFIKSSTHCLQKNSFYSYPMYPIVYSCCIHTNTYMKFNRQNNKHWILSSENCLRFFWCVISFWTLKNVPRESDRPEGRGDYLYLFITTSYIPIGSSCEGRNDAWRCMCMHWRYVLHAFEGGSWRPLKGLDSSAARGCIGLISCCK